jgi:hypothetical protein
MIEKTRKVVVAAVELKHRMLLKVRKIIDFIVWLYCASCLPKRVAKPN